MKTVKKWLRNSKFLFIVKQLVPREQVEGVVCLLFLFGFVLLLFVFCCYYWLRGASLWIGAAGKMCKESVSNKNVTLKQNVIVL